MVAPDPEPPASRRLWGALSDEGAPRPSAPDRWALSDLVQVYALAVDDCDVPTVVDTFHLDGVFVRGGAEVTGRAALTEFFERMTRAYRTTLHIPQSHVVIGGRGSTAHGIATGQAELVHGDGTLVLAAYRYADDYVVDSGCWRFARRVLTFHYALEASRRSVEMGDARRIRRPGSDAEVADHPESAATWRDRHPSG